MPSRRIRGSVLANRPRTLQSIQSNLLRVPRPVKSKSLMSSYLMCASNPFSAAKSVGIPDGSSANRIVVDHRAYTTITTGSSGGFHIRLLPVPNMPVVIKPNTQVNNDSTFAVGTSTVPANGSGVLFDWTSDTWMPAITPYEWASYNAAAGYAGTPGSGIVPEIPNPYGATKFRIVSLAVRLIYTGTALNAAGIIRVRRNRSMYTYGGALNQSTLTTYLNNGTNVTTDTSLTARSFYTSRFDINDASNIMDKTVMTYRPEVPITARLIQTEDHYEFANVYPVKVQPLDTGTYRQCIVAVGSGQQPIYTNNPGFAGYDNRFDDTIISATGIPSGNTYTLELALCIEYTPSQTSTFAPLAKGADGSPTLVAAARNTLRNMSASNASNQPPLGGGSNPKRGGRK